MAMARKHIHLRFAGVPPALPGSTVRKYAILTPRDPSAPIIIYDVTDPVVAQRENDILDPPYNKHRHGLWPDSPRFQQCKQDQKDINDGDMVRLYQAFQAKLTRRHEELGWDLDKVKAEVGPLVMLQANGLYYGHIWRKRKAVEMRPGYLDAIFRYWRDISLFRPRVDYGELWEYVAEKKLPIHLMLDPDEDVPRTHNYFLD